MKAWLPPAHVVKGAASLVRRRQHISQQALMQLLLAPPSQGNGWLEFSINFNATDVTLID
jgi:hypothetical protein